MTTNQPTKTVAETFWDGFYDERPQVWSGQPNSTLIQEVSKLTLGTTLLLVGHGPPWPGEPDPHPEVSFPTPDEQAVALGINDGGWTIVRSELIDLASHGPDARPDSILVARRNP